MQGKCRFPLDLLTRKESDRFVLMHALVRFAHIAGRDTFTTRDLHPAAAPALDATTDQYRLASPRYDVSKLRAKASTRKCRTPVASLVPQGLQPLRRLPKLFERVYAPLTAGLLRPVAADAGLAEDKRHQLDHIYQRASRISTHSCAPSSLRSAARISCTTRTEFS